MEDVGLYMTANKTMRSGLIFTSLLLIGSVSAKDSDFRQYIVSLSDEARSSGIDEQTISLVENKVKYFRKEVLKENIHSKTYQNFDSFLTETVTEHKVDKLNQLFINYHEELKKIGAHYQVQPRFILALWGRLSDAGISLDSYSVLSVMLSKAFISRSEEDKNQYLAALKVLDNKMVSIEELNSDHNGLMGQIKISPEFFDKYGQDWESDGKSDIWHNNLDSFATIAFFLQQSGWNNSLTWGRQVKVNSDKSEPMTSYRGTKSFTEWSDLGVTRYNGNPLPNRPDVKAMMLTPVKSKERHYLVYNNYKIIKMWPTFDDYNSLSVFYLSERLNSSIKTWRKSQAIQ